MSRQLKGQAAREKPVSTGVRITSLNGVSIRIGQYSRGSCTRPSEGPMNWMDFAIPMFASPFPDWKKRFTLSLLRQKVNVIDTNPGDN